MQLEIIHGPESYSPENYLCTDPACPAHGRSPVAPPRPPAPFAPPEASDESLPEVRGGFSEVYSNKHEKILLRVDHVAKMDAIRKAFNAGRLHAEQPPMTTSDIVNACLDFVLQHRIAFAALKRAEELPKFIAESVYRDVVSRWRQWNEVF